MLSSTGTSTTTSRIQTRSGAAPLYPHLLSSKPRRRSDRAAAIISSSSSNGRPNLATMTEYRHSRSGSLNIPPQSATMSPTTPSQGRFEGPRSPPSKSGSSPLQRHNKPLYAFAMHNAIRHSADRSIFSIADTSHVPCKFFRQGACQAGSACPFSHDLGSAAETVCKYFAKVRPVPPVRASKCPHILLNSPTLFFLCLRGTPLYLEGWLLDRVTSATGD